MTNTRSIPATLPTTVRTDLVARMVHLAAPALLAVFASIWAVSQKTAGYDRTSATAAENRQWIYDHEKLLSEHEKKLAVSSADIANINSVLISIQSDLHEIRRVIMHDRRDRSPETETP